ncbi:hypothetical protein GBAR_LOCUS19502 [Geodia barretti]|uniref:PH domain-containing protein n=1 Tax=Geodia barretti TaxID=519541 RepID=A0AA35STZ3_GEOBA|nr:hypothetical protein GBAR_LOCUS19502 [Geodia barretti]
MFHLLESSLPPQFPLSTLSSKRMWMVLCRKGPSGRPRIEMYRSEDSVAGQQPVRMIDLETVRSVQPVERKKSFLIELPEETMMLQCTSKADMEDWVRDTNRLRGGRVDLASGQNIGGHLPGHDIYEVVPDDETFRVRLRKSSTINFSGSCLLEIQRYLLCHCLFHFLLFSLSAFDFCCALSRLCSSVTSPKTRVGVFLDELF